MKRIASYDIIRAIALIAIVLAHQLLTAQAPFLFAMGKWLGATFSAVFLGLSALVLGGSWAEKGKPAYGVRFLLRRLSRLAIPYWLFLSVFLLIAYATGHPFPWKDVLMNYVFLGWLAKIPGIGHLWFITMIVICYVACVGVSRLFATARGRMIFPVALLIGCVCLYAVFHRFGLPAYMALIIFYYCIMFAYADRILDGLRRYGRQVLRWGVPSLLALVVALFLSGILTSGKENLIALNCSILGIFILLLLQAVLDGIAAFPRVISTLSGISYEWYLVHHPMIIGPLALVSVIHARPLAVVCYWLLSLVCAFLLNYLSSIVYKLFRA